MTSCHERVLYISFERRRALTSAAAQNRALGSLQRECCSASLALLLSLAPRKLTREQSNDRPMASRPEHAHRGRGPLGDGDAPQPADSGTTEQ